MSLGIKLVVNSRRFGLQAEHFQLLSSSDTARLDGVSASQDSVDREEQKRLRDRQ